jgi:hypothetical protein
MPMVSAIRHSGVFDDQDFSWLTDFVASLPKAFRSRARGMASPTLHRLSSPTNRQIITARKTTTVGASMFLSKRVAVYSARLFMRSLLIRWELLLPWRAFNIANCQLGHNLYGAHYDPLSRVRAPEWVIEQATDDENADFWMYYFLANETKNGYSVAGFVLAP